MNEEMTCDEFKALAPAYAMLALEDGEQRACARHLAVMAPHQGCPQALAQAELVAARLGGALPPQVPPPRVWKAIRARLEDGDRPGDDLVARRTGAAVDEAAAHRWSLYQLCGWLVAATLLGLYLHHAPLDFGHHKRPAGEPGAGIRGGLAPRALAVEAR